MAENSKFDETQIYGFGKLIELQTINPKKTMPIKCNQTAEKHFLKTLKATRER